jgi:hypothetical protein
MSADPQLDDYVRGLRRRGVQPNETLLRALSARLRERASAGKEERLRTRVGEIQQRYRQRDREIRQEGARMAWITCPIVILFFGFSALLNFLHGDMSMGAFFVPGALVFLGMLVVAHRRAR